VISDLHILGGGNWQQLSARECSEFVEIDIQRDAGCYSARCIPYILKRSGRLECYLERGTTELIKNEALYNKEETTETSQLNC
jgi:hypothetical protein